MSNIVISGYYGFGNAGDEAMLCAIIDAIRKEEADAHITVISGNPKETSKKHNINAVGTFSALGILKAIAHSDLVISGGGSLLQDATSIRNTYYYLSIMALAKLLGKKVMLYSQGIGPLNRSSTRRAVGFVLRFVDTITVRDSISKDELVSLGIEDVEVTADAVLAMQPADLSIGSHILKGYISKISEADEQRKRIGVAVRSWKEDTEYRESLANVLSRLQEQDNVDGRIVATMPEYYIGIVKGSTIVPNYDDMFDILSEMQKLPNYVGFITGPSRTADIECVGTVGVHGPIEVSIVVVDDE